MARVSLKAHGEAPYLSVVHDYKDPDSGAWRQFTVGCGRADSAINVANAYFLAAAIDAFLAGGPPNMDASAWEAVAVEHIGSDVLNRLKVAGLAPVAQGAKIPA